ncbi:hypothetical protein ABZ816_40950 [Actinosynnema sp. NPDC047251]|uniref:Putative secreted protein n=1 Tax=Saccharothrix espanaensis (strain ATCC 51144 / DSM 44229 / JCM 9112 / NBRC 15066 / NRRL 15764) TaxID=1179773 RepID=K0K2V3_SACES|nr:hypothetical protein [Saccharothrix espanaensis]CCH34570.1 putative secreted protein [Saccharothrix espanaensis DSM 44229]
MRLRVLALAVLLTGCASGGNTAAPLSTTPDDFPATTAPRPIVLIGDLLQVVDGLRGDDKVDSGLNFTAQHPPTPQPAPVALPDGTRPTLPLIGSSDALNRMPRRTAPTTTSTLVSVEFGTAEFPTDRGPWTLPAWRFTSEAGSVLAWPALEPGAFWKPGEVRPAISTDQATATDRELTVSMPAAPAPCPGDAPARNEAVVQETAGTVTVGVRTIGEVGNCARTLAVTTQPYRVPLAAPLGNRLLVDEQGGVIVVTRP